ncbi:hypothetical protein [Tenacibaculum agarivorans]|uniref:hypothetical protein n=1 Tax=Tenacibaculum agarivorans TaxID=1908389 RepID=UPI000A8B877F|nr:hypothetical protein [Tenacibaculum agarivorans]
MEDFFTFLSTHSNGILMLILLVFSAIYALNWLAKIFKWGRYNISKLDNDEATQAAYGDMSYVFTQFLVKIISDFKHLLALVIVLIFTGLIIFSMATTPEFDEKMEALQLVIASLGGLLGTVIGYYFGESASNKQESISTTEEETQDNVRNEIFEEEMQVAPNPDINFDEEEQP